MGGGWVYASRTSSSKSISLTRSDRSGCYGRLSEGIFNIIMSQKDYYKSIPTSIEEENSAALGSHHVHVKRSSADAEVKSYIVETAGEHRPNKKEDFMSNLQYHSVFMEKPFRPPKKPPKYSLSKRLSNKAKKKLGLFYVPSGKYEYKDFLPLHELWLGYMNDVLQIKTPKEERQAEQLSQKVLKADYHGSILRVWRSKCPSYVGSEGIVVQETQNTVRLVTKEDKIRTIPKAHSIFTFEFQGYRFFLYGDHMKFKSSERSARKFKDKPTIDL